MTTTHQPATDLGHLLHKHPDRAQSFTTSSGVAHVFYPKATNEECTVALLLEVDPIALVRGPGSTLTQYVNDRPYAAGSLLTVALGSVFRTAMNGRSESYPSSPRRRFRWSSASLRCHTGSPRSCSRRSAGTSRSAGTATRASAT